jgi:uncharacterized RDD family membrane protein YckC
MINQNEQTLKKASSLSRIAACIIDLFVMTFLMLLIVAIVLGSDHIDNYDRAYIHTILFLVLITGLILYFSKDSYRGISVGRWIMGIMVRNESDNQVPSYFRLFIRNLFTIIWPVEFIVLLVNSDKKRIADKVSKTIVLKNPVKTKGIFRIGVLFIIGICFYFFVEIYGAAIFRNSEAYEIAVDSIKQNEMIIEKTGGFEGYEGKEVSVTSDYEIIKIGFTIKVIGKENDIVVNVNLERKPNQEWIIDDIVIAANTQ